MSPDYDLDPWNRSHPKNSHVWEYDEVDDVSHCEICSMTWDGRFGKDGRKERKG